jgi:hypothetical protein
MPSDAAPSAPVLPSNPLRCSAVTRAAGVDPVGTAGSYAGYLLVEWPLPWPRDIGAVEELARLDGPLGAAGIRLQALVPRDGASGDRRLILYRQPAGALFAGYERDERAVHADEVVDGALKMVAAMGAGPHPEPTGDVTADVLVCTHGQRDVCCGSMGTAFASALVADRTPLGPGVRTWRTSHTGGHRFAPTGVVLPQGTVWAHLDVDALHRIVRREGPLDDLLPRYRGCAGVGPPMVQAVEREVFALHGWPWLDHGRRGRVVDGGRVRLDAVAPDGSAQAWEATVEVGRTVPVPECGRPLDEAKKSESEWRVTGLRPA